MSDLRYDMLEAEYEDLKADFERQTAVIELMRAVLRQGCPVNTRLCRFGVALSPAPAQTAELDEVTKAAMARNAEYAASSLCAALLPAPALHEARTECALRGKNRSRKSLHTKKR